MATTTTPPALQVNGSTTAAPVAANTVTDLSEKRAELRLTMLKKLRPYPLRHEWVFWHDRNAAAAAGAAGADEKKYEDQLKEIAQISTVQVCMRFPVSIRLPSISLLASNFTQPLGGRYEALLCRMLIRRRASGKSSTTPPSRPSPSAIATASLRKTSSPSGKTPATPAAALGSSASPSHNLSSSGRRFR